MFPKKRDPEQEQRAPRGSAPLPAGDRRTPNDLSRPLPDGVPPSSAALVIEADGTADVACSLGVDRRGLVIAMGPASPFGDQPVRVGWRALVGVGADATAEGADGIRRHVLEVRTTRGTLRFLADARTVSQVVQDLGSVAMWWELGRRPVPAAAGVAVAGAVAASSRLVVSAAGSVHRRATSTARGVTSLVASASSGAWSVTGPIRRQLSRTIVWLAVAAASRAVAAMAVQLLTTAPTEDRPRRARPLGATLVVGAMVASTIGGLALGGPDASGVAHGPSANAGNPGLDNSSIGRIASALRNGIASASVTLPPATAAPAPTPPSLAGAPPLSAHEVFGFAPYWSLPSSAGFDVAGMTTLAYFSIGVNADGSLNESGPGWAGYQSQALTTLINRAHAAGDRVVLTVNCFDQASLDKLTSSPTAPATLATALVSAIEAKNLNGVNLDLEGAGSQDQAGLTNLVSTVSSTLHQVDPHWQVTMDTYASSAGDPGGFYNIKALAPSVDAFFVMAYQLNLSGTSSAASPLTSAMFSDETTAAQYAAAVPADKVILGLPYFGYDWPTTDGTMAAQATGGAVPITYGQVAASGRPIYWDNVTDTAWTSYQVGNQWHEDYFENPASLYMAASLAQQHHLGGVGIWALGMEGGDPAMLSALDGFAPAQKAPLTGPAATSTSPTTTSTTTASGSTPATSVPSNSAVVPGSGSTTTTAPAYSYSGTFEGQTVSLTPQTGVALGSGPISESLTGFTTDDPVFSCLTTAAHLAVWSVAGSASQYVAVADAGSGACASGSFVFTAPGGSGGAGGSSTTTTTSTIPSHSVTSSTNSRSGTSTSGTSGTSTSGTTTSSG